MAHYNVSNANHLSKLRMMLQSKDAVLLVGSAISMFAPSDLPTGAGIVSELTDFFLQNHHTAASRYELTSIRNFINEAAFEHLMNSCPNAASFQSHLSSQFGFGPSNEVHEKIAELMSKHGVSVITTNYDALIEDALRTIGSPYSRIIEQKHITKHLSTPTIFKIHGCVSNPSSIVFSLSQETLLPDWKFDAFAKLLNGKNLFIIGYSGKDFEICPALTAATPNHIFWNSFKFDPHEPVFDSENMEHLYNSVSNFSVLSGNMLDLFGCMPNRPSASKRGLVQDYVSKFLSQSEQQVWRASTFDSLAAPKFAQREIDKGTSTNSPVEETRPACLYRRGKYISSYFERTKAIFQNRISSEDILFDVILDGSFKLRNAGFTNFAKIFSVMAAQRWKKLPIRMRFQQRLPLTWSLYLNLGRFYPNRRSRWMTFYAIRALKSGAWGDYYNIEPHLRRDGIDIAPFLKLKKPLMQARSGFSHIGNLSAFIDEFTRDSYQSPGRLFEYITRIKAARVFELNPNGWKCAYALLFHGSKFSARARRYALRQFFHLLLKCEYTPLFMLFISYSGISSYMGFSSRRFS